MKLRTMDLQIMLVVLTYHKPGNNDSNWVNKADKHRDFGDLCCRPVGVTGSVNDFIVDQMVLKLVDQLAVDHLVN